MGVYVGCCGIPGGLERYSKEFKVVEINSTFYRLPQIKTAERWRNIVPKDFIFCVKCHQGVTHPIRSPTWRRSGLKQEELEKLKDRVGFLRHTKEVFEFWEKTLEICRILKNLLIFWYKDKAHQPLFQDLKKSREKELRCVLLFCRALLKFPHPRAQDSWKPE